MKKYQATKKKRVSFILILLIIVNSPSNKDLTAEINYFSQRLGTLEYEYFETKSSEKEKQIREIKEKLFILKEKNKKFHEGSKKRDVFEEAMMKKIFGEYFTKKTKLKKKIINHELKNNKTRLVFPNNAFKSFDEKLQQCSNAKEYELIKEEFLQIFQKTFDFEEEIDSWHLDESEIL